MFLNDVALVQSHSMARGSEFGEGKLYPYKVQTVPIDSFEGKAYILVDIVMYI